LTTRLECSERILRTRSLFRNQNAFYYILLIYASCSNIPLLSPATSGGSPTTARATSVVYATFMHPHFCSGLARIYPITLIHSHTAVLKLTLFFFPSKPSYFRRLYHYRRSHIGGVCYIHPPSLLVGLRIPRIYPITFMHSHTA